MIQIIKTGGTVAGDVKLMELLIREIADSGVPAVLVHGGGKAVTEISRRLGITSVFREGVRLTAPEEMAVVDMVLAGLTNTELVRAAYRAGVPAVGLTGADSGLFTGALMFPGEGGRTARVSSINLAPIAALHARGFLPIVATVGVGEDGEAVNINADEAAQALAQAVAREQQVELSFIADTPGVLDDQGQVIGSIPVREVEALIRSGVVRDGMAAKIRSCASAVTAGVGRIVIGTYRETGDVGRLREGTAGTVVFPGGDNDQGTH